MYSHLFTVTVHTPVYSYLLHICSNIIHTCSGWQKMWASSCWNLRTRVSPLRAPESSFLCNTPKSAILSGNSRHERWRWSNIKLKKQNTGMKNSTQLQQPKHCVEKKERNAANQCPGQFIGFRANFSFSTSHWNMLSWEGKQNAHQF